MLSTFEEFKNKFQEFIDPEIILKEQAFLCDIKQDELKNKIFGIFSSMKTAIKNGLNSNELSKSGLSGDNTSKLINNGNLGLISNFSKKAILYSFATIEENARMGKIAACPTAGSSGIVPGVLVAYMEEFNKTDDEIVNALIVAGEIGRIVSDKVPPAGASAGCQAECGLASSMASAALTFLSGGNTDMVLNSVALALKNILGLTCDPVLGLVEVPCVKRNPFLAQHAITASYLALSGIKSKISLDDVVDAMKETGLLMSPKLKESSEAGLAVVKSALSFKKDNIIS